MAEFISPTAILVIAVVGIGAFLVYIFLVATAPLAPGAMNIHWKYLLDAGLVVLIIVLIWKSARSWMNNRNGDQPD